MAVKGFEGELFPKVDATCKKCGTQKVRLGASDETGCPKCLDLEAVITRAQRGVERRVRKHEEEKNLKRHGNIGIVMSSDLNKAGSWSARDILLNDDIPKYDLDGNLIEMEEEPC